MSRLINMSTVNNTDHDREGFIVTLGAGSVIAQTCPACGNKHNGKRRDKCSKIKQQMRREGKL